MLRINADPFNVAMFVTTIEPMISGFRMADRCYSGPVVDLRPDSVAYGMALPAGAADALRAALEGFIAERS